MEERNENVMTYEENVNTDTEVEVSYAEPEEAAIGLDYKLIGLGAAALIGGVVAVKKFVAPKVKTWNEKRLAKKGYVKLQPGEQIVKIMVNDEDSDDAVETEEEK